MTDSAALMGDVAAFKARPSYDSSDPWTRPRLPAASTAAPPAEEPVRVPNSGAARSERQWPLKMNGLLGAITFKDRTLFDDKVMLTSDYQWDGVKGGAAWKSRVERYFITKAPVLRELLEWAEAQDAEAITEDQVVEATSNRLSSEQAMAVNSQIWGFLSGCLRGTAETMFRRAECLNGIDAWRRLVRQVDHGRGIRLEMLRREVQELHTRPIKSLEAIEEGVAVFENTMTEYARAGGRESTDAELKSDLLRILPREIRETLLWHSTDVGVSFQRFRDTVVAQTADSHEPRQLAISPRRQRRSGGRKLPGRHLPNPRRLRRRPEQDRRADPRAAGAHWATGVPTTSTWHSRAGSSHEEQSRGQRCEAAQLPKLRRIACRYQVPTP